MRARFLGVMILCLAAGCGRNSETVATAPAEVRERAPSGDPATLPKVAAEAGAIGGMLRERFGEGVTRNLRIGVENQGSGSKVSLLGEVPNEEIRQAVMKELEARVPDMKSQDFTLSVAGPIRQVSMFDVYLRGDQQLVYSSDLSMVVTELGTIYEVATGRRINRMVMPQQQVTALAISPDKKTLAMGLQGGGIHLWDLPLGRNMKVLNPTAPPTAGYQRIAAMQFLADGKQLAVVNSQFGEVIVWDLANGSSKTIGSHVARDSGRSGNTTWVMAVSPDGKSIASVEENGDFVSLWDVKARSRKMLESQRLSAKAMAWSRNGKTLAVARGVGDRRGTVLFDVATGKATVLSRERDDLVAAIAFSPDDRTLAVYHQSEGVVLWDLATGKEWMTIPQEKVGGGMAVAFSADGSLLATDGQSQRPPTIRLWNVAKRPGSKVAAAALPAGLGVTTQQDDRLVEGMLRSMRQYQGTGLDGVTIEVLGDHHVRLTGRVASEATRERAGRDAANYYLSEDTYGERRNRVVNDLQVTGGAGGRGVPR